MVINDPAVLAEMSQAFAAYETALLANDNMAIGRMFLADPATVRYGLADIQHGIDEILAFRATQAPFERRLERLVITTYGRDFATASTLFIRPDAPGKIGRQMQSWVRTEAGWRVAAAHVSMMDAPA